MAGYTIVPVAAGSELHFEILKPDSKDSILTYNLLYVAAAYRATF